jgi:hypothetical protein
LCHAVMSATVVQASTALDNASYIRSGKRMMNPSRVGIRTFGNVVASSAGPDRLRLPRPDCRVAQPRPDAPVPVRLHHLRIPIGPFMRLGALVVFPVGVLRKFGDRLVWVAVPPQPALARHL